VALPAANGRAVTRGALNAGGLAVVGLFA